MYPWMTRHYQQLLTSSLCSRKLGTQTSRSATKPMQSYATTEVAYGNTLLLCQAQQRCLIGIYICISLSHA